MATRSALQQTMQRPDVADDRPKRPESQPAQSVGHPASVAAFAAFVAPKIEIPLTRLELAAAYLRIVELAPPPTIAASLNIKENSVSVYLWRAKLKLGAPAFHGWEPLIAAFWYEAGFAAGRAAR